MGLLKKLVMGIIAFFVIIIGFTYFTTRGASEAADKFIGYVQTSDADSAFDLLSVEGKKVGSKEDFTSFIEEIGPAIKGELSNNGVGVSAGTGEETVSTIKYKIKGDNGNEYVAVVELVKEEGEWKVLSFDSDPASEQDE